ncbi:MAG: class I SAM-dependent methyltransferase [Candidatus Omnitrophica bacterium]|nr:class I SAM-dependent methyltransferase [Candidatus Omnitrophota bacterium]
MYTKDFDAEYREKGAYHHTLAGFSRLWYERNYRLLADGLHGKILDVACGDGRLADYIRDKDAVIDGFDASGHAVGLARQKKVYRDLWVGDITDPAAYTRDTYDFFVCSLSLQYLAEPALVRHFNDMKRLVAGGRVYRFTFPNTELVPKAETMRAILRPVFSRVDMVTVTGFIKDAGAMDAKKLAGNFNKAKNDPVEKSYHYMVTVSD